MKKIDTLMNQLDKQVDQKMRPVWHFMHKYFVLFSSTLLLGLLFLLFFRLWYQRPYMLSSLMHEDLQNLEAVLHAIDNDCDILSIRTGQGVIDFLTVEKFVGSTVGCLNLAFPGRWKGPYAGRNPTMEGKFYEIVSAHEGYFVVPGKGARLPDGKIMGKDIVIEPQTVMQPMLQPGGCLYYNDRALAIRLSFKVGDWHIAAPANQTIDKINESIDELQQALPFAQLVSKPETKVC